MYDNGNMGGGDLPITTPGCASMMTYSGSASWAGSVSPNWCVGTEVSRSAARVR